MKTAKTYPHPIHRVIPQPGMRFRRNPSRSPKDRMASVAIVLILLSFAGFGILLAMLFA
jgi:hypothetical protein